MKTIERIIAVSLEQDLLPFPRQSTRMRSRMGLATPRFGNGEAIRSLKGLEATHHSIRIRATR